ncbi:MAG: hypothetical protein K0R67_3309, partial [Paenibacillus sp.]|nr:hypothetical protein [Paenibacillus sp.]
RMFTNLRRVKLALTSRLHLWYMLFSVLFGKLAAYLIPSKRAADAPISSDMKQVIIRLKIRSSEAAIDAIRKHYTGAHNAAASRVIRRYNRIIAELRSQLSFDSDNQLLNKQVRGLEMVAIQAERDEIQFLYQQRLLKKGQHNKLQLMISLREADSIEKESDEPSV